MHSTEGLTRGAHKLNPYSTPNIKTFGAKKSIYYNLIFTKNSPLIPMFKKATIKTFETGQYDRIANDWQGGEIKSQGRVCNPWEIIPYLLQILSPRGKEIVPKFNFRG